MIWGKTNLMYDTPHKISVTPPDLELGQCADIVKDPDIEVHEDGTHVEDRRSVIERALESTCGNPWWSSGP